MLFPRNGHWLTAWTPRLRAEGSVPAWPRTRPPSPIHDGSEPETERFRQKYLVLRILPLVLASAALFGPGAASAQGISGIALTSDPGNDDTYAIGDEVVATVTFDAAVDITGLPGLEMDFDGTAKSSTCANDTNTTTMVCSYTVALGEEAPNGVAIAANKLTGGTITATGSTTSADLDHTAVAIDAGHKVDGIRPTLSEAVTSTDGTKVILTFSEDLDGETVPISDGGTTLLSVKVGGTAVTLSGSTAPISGNLVTLTLATALTSATQAVTVSYADPTGGDDTIGIEDLAGNDAASFTDQAVTNRFGAPEVSSVALTSAPGSDDTYAFYGTTLVTPDVVEATVTFDAAVDITGSPQLELDFAGTPKAASCATGTNTTTMVCSYTVAENDSAPNGIAIAADKLTLNGGTIYATGSTTVAAGLTHSAVSIDSGHKVDGIRPTLVTTGDDAPKTSTDGSQIIFTASEDIGSVMPGSITLKSEGSSISAGITATFSGRTVTVTLLATLTIQYDQTVTLTLGIGAVRDTAGNRIAAVSTEQAVTNNVPKPPAVITGVEITSDPGMDKIYAPGDDIEVTATFDEAVNVSGTPRIEVRLGGAGNRGDRWAEYSSGTGTTALVFSYTVEATDESSIHGIAVGRFVLAADNLDLNGGTITTVAAGENASLAYAPLQSNAGHLVNWARPTLSEAVTSTDGTKVILTFSEDLDGETVSISDGGTTLLSVEVDGTAVTLSGSTATVSGKLVTLTLATALTSATQAVTVSYTDPTSGDDSIGIEDLAGNDAASFTDQTVTNRFGAVPEVSSVALTSAPGSDNTYAIGDAVEATVTFIEAVDISGSPQLELDFDGTAKAAACATGTNTTTMVCSYTVLVGEEAPNGVAIAANKLTGGTIYATGSTTVSADLDHTAVAIDAGHKVDGIRPTLVTTGTDAPTTSTDGTKVILTFSEDISAADRTKITIQANSVTAATSAESVTGTKVELTLTTALTASAANLTVALAADGVVDAASNGILALAATTVTNATPPTVTGIALTSAPGSDNTYAIGDAVAATVTFDAAVDITGSPELELDFDGTAKAAACAAATNTTTMACSYTVLAGEEAPNGIAIAANKLTGGTIYATGSTTISADLDHSAVSIDTGHKVDGIRPTLVTTGTDAPTTSTDGTKVILTFSEDISAADRTKITIQANSVTAATSAESVTGTKVELTLTTALTASATNLTVALAADAVDDTAGNGILALAATPVTNAVGQTTCTSSSTAVSGFTGTLTDLVTDCNTLLGLMDTLRGTQSLNWAETLSMSSWDGVNVAGTPKRVNSLDLNRSMTGSIPAALGDLSALTFLDLEDNSFSGSIPAELNQLTNLRVLVLGNVGLTGTIPDLSALTSLELLRISDNKLTGGIPTWLGDLTSLETLILKRNPLGGEIPAQLGNLSNLRTLELDETGLTGTIPAELGNLSNLERFHLFDDPAINDPLQDNALEGEIPATWGTATHPLPNVRELSLAGNALEGEIPEALGGLNSLTRLALYSNALEGGIPATWGTATHPLPNLIQIELSGNALEGEIPEALGGLSSLEILKLHRNQLSGAIPAALGQLTNLTTLWLHGNKLESPLPDLSTLTAMEDLDLSYNPLLTDTFPAWLADLSNLQYLYLRFTGLSGPIPAGLGTLSSLVHLHLAATDWTGTIPQALLDKQTAGTLSLWTNRRPVPPAVEAQTLIVGQQFEYPVAFSDPDTDTLTYHATLAGATPEDADLPLPAWLAIDAMTGTLSGTPPRAERLMVRVLATDEDSPPSPPTDEMPFCGSTPSPTETNPPALCGAVLVSLTLVTTPDAPTNLTAAPGDRQIRLDWTAPASDGGAGITDYEYEQNGSGTWISTGGTAPSTTVTGLMNGQPYTYKVRAVNRAGASDPSAASGSVTPARKPNAPTGLTATPGDEQVTLNWTAPASNGGPTITDYEYEQNGSGTWISTGGTAVTYTVRNLANGQPYTFKVRAVNRGVASDPSAASGSVTPARKPNAPTGLTATAGDEQVTLNWTAPASDGGAGITDYEYEQNGSGTWISTGGTAVTYTVMGLTNGQSYTFKVRAVNRAGASDPSAASGSVTPASVPDAPTGLTATAGNKQVTLNWTAPASDGGETITRYEYEQNGSGTWISTGGTAPSTTVTGLMNGLSYRFKVRAVNSIGASDPSAASGSVTPARKPDAPTGLSATVSDQSVVLIWTAPASNGAAILRYEYEQNGSGAWTSTGGTAPSHTVRNLTNGQSYSFRVRAVNRAGEGAASGSQSATPTATLVAPDAPTGLSATAGNRRVRLDWVQPSGGAAITHYEYELDGSGTWTSTGGTAASYTVMGLTNEQSYSFRVRAVNSAGRSGASGSQSATPTVTAPDAPRRLRSTPGDGQVRLRWTAPANDGGDPITHYEYELDGSGTWISTGSAALSTTVSDLVNGRTYTFRVRAVNAQGNGDVVTLQATPSPSTGGGGRGPRTTAPDAPGNLTAAAADGVVTLSWDAPIGTGGAPITDYEYQIDGEGEWISIGSVKRTHTITGLTGGTVHVFRVRAVNRIGAGRASDPAEVTLPVLVVLDFTHFANGGGITSEMVLVSVATHPIRPALYFYDRQGLLVDPASVVDVTMDLEVTESGSLTVRTGMEPLGVLTIATHGRGELVSGSVAVVSYGPLGGGVRYTVPHAGVTGAGASPPVGDVVFPARRQEGGIRTAASLHNLEEEAVEVTCRLMSGGVALEEVENLLEANGQSSWFIEDAFPMTDTSDFLGSVRCMAAGGREFTAVAIETDAAQGIYTTLPVMEVDRTGGRGGETVLDFAHLANGNWITELVLVNLSIQPSGPSLFPFDSAIRPSRPAIYFHDTEGNPIAPGSVVDLTSGLEVTDDGALTVSAAMKPLGQLTIPTHGRGELVTGSVRVVSEGPIGGMLRFSQSAYGAAGVGPGLPLSEAVFPVWRREGGITTGFALHNLEEEAAEVTCDLMREGGVLDTVSLPLEANGQTSWTIQDAFPATDTSDFSGAVRCSAGGGLFTALALEMDSGSPLITALPVVAVPEMPSPE